MTGWKESFIPSLFGENELGIKSPALTVVTSLT